MSFRRALLEDVTTYQERLASHLTKMLRRSRNVLRVCAQEHERYYPTPPHPTPPHRYLITKEQCSACVCRTARKMMRLLCLCAHRNVNVITPPHPTPPVTDHERAVQCVCLQDSKKDDEVAVPDSMSQPRVPKCYPKGMILWCSK